MMIRWTLCLIAVGLWVFFVRSDALFHEATMMFLSEGGNSDFVNIWNGGSLNDPSGDRHNWNVTMLSTIGNFRSAHLDLWTTTDYPVEVYLVLYNSQGDDLWHIGFNSVGCSYDITCWMVPSRIIEAKSALTNTTTDISIETTGLSQIYIKSSTNTDLIWFSVWNADLMSTPDPPMFIFSNDVNTPFPISTTESIPSTGSGDDTLTYEGCHSIGSLGATFQIQDITSMSVTLCLSYCSPSYDLVILEIKTKCYCATLGSLGSPFSDTFCDGACPGDASQICGDISSIGAVFSVTSATTQPPTTVTKPSYSDVIASVMISTSLLNGNSEIEVDVTSYLGDISNAGFITGTSLLILTSPSLTFTLEYSDLNCDENIRKEFQHFDPIYSNGTMISTGILEVRCMWFVFADPASATVTADIQLFYQNETRFISAPYIAVHVIHEIEDTTTTTETTTTTTPRTTTSTTAETTTTTMETTTTTTAETTTTTMETTTTTTAETTTTTPVTTSTTSEATTTTTPETTTTLPETTTTTLVTTTTTPETTTTTSETTTTLPETTTTTQETTTTTPETTTTTSETTTTTPETTTTLPETTTTTPVTTTTTPETTTTTSETTTTLPETTTTTQETTTTTPETTTTLPETTTTTQDTTTTTPETTTTTSETTTTTPETTTTLPETTTTTPVTTTTTPETTTTTPETTTTLPETTTTTPVTTTTTLETTTTTAETTTIFATDTTVELITSETPVAFSSTNQPLTTSSTNDNNSCLCQCVSDMSMSNEELLQAIKQIQDTLRVNKTSLSSYVRTKTSAKDDRPSAKGLGSLGAAVIASVFLCVVFIDLTNFMKYVKTFTTQKRVLTNGNSSNNERNKTKRD